MTLDARTEANIATLVPPAQIAARAFMEALTAMLPDGVTASIISALRTYAEQDALYAQGRTKPGKIVTNARASFSNHNFGVAWDVGLFKKRPDTTDGEGNVTPHAAVYLEDSPLYKLVEKAAHSCGLIWGGSWKFSDEPHVEWSPASLADLSESDRLAEFRKRVARGVPVSA